MEGADLLIDLRDRGRREQVRVVDHVAGPRKGRGDRRCDGDGERGERRERFHRLLAPPGPNYPAPGREVAATYRPLDTMNRVTPTDVTTKMIRNTHTNALVSLFQ